MLNTNCGRSLQNSFWLAPFALGYNNKNYNKHALQLERLLPFPQPISLSSHYITFIEQSTFSINYQTFFQ